MGTTVSIESIVPRGAAVKWKRALTAVEVLLVYSGILLQIWRWQFTHPRLWMLLLGMALVSHVVHRDTPKSLGLTADGLPSCAWAVLRLALVIYGPLVAYGFASHRLILMGPSQQALASFWSYGIWCVFQQYLSQSYFNNRLLTLLRNPHASSLTMALMFGATHIPNPVLMVVTAGGGFILAEVFARHRNIWPLALAQAVGGFLIAAITPAGLIHNMRVGPGYFFYHLH